MLFCEFPSLCEGRYICPKTRHPITLWEEQRCHENPEILNPTQIFLSDYRTSCLWDRSVNLSELPNYYVWVASNRDISFVLFFFCCLYFSLVLYCVVMYCVMLFLSSTGYDSKSPRFQTLLQRERINFTYIPNNCHQWQWQPIHFQSAARLINMRRNNYITHFSLFRQTVCHILPRNLPGDHLRKFSIPPNFTYSSLTF